DLAAHSLADQATARASRSGVRRDSLPFSRRSGVTPGHEGLIHDTLGRRQIKTRMLMHDPPRQPAPQHLIDQLSDMLPMRQLGSERGFGEQLGHSSASLAIRAAALVSNTSIR
ncbi:hypothetical protein, partial [Acrocarpospora sp. B8E8]|uniref:hypothetical protein n=1 Tax=Acrocarpospora sp. B8E8 TaxID=3153572 RepID=UPI00325E644B